MGQWGDIDGFLRDARLGDVARELERLAEQANRLRAELAATAASTHWSGAAADGFRARARQRENEVAELVGTLDSARSAVGAAHAMASVF
ncbi:MAG TPA: hypothetical protein VFN97_23575 [Actinospica sp.]|nr:hypothetical protein [Actinospica sp.]